MQLSNEVLEMLKALVQEMMKTKPMKDNFMKPSQPRLLYNQMYFRQLIEKYRDNIERVNKFLEISLQELVSADQHHTRQSIILSTSTKQQI